MKLKCLIVDDEAPAHQVIMAHIQKTEQLELTGTAYNGKEALSFLLEHKVDLIFLDINMPKLNGIDLLDCLPYTTTVILTTAYSNFAFEAYQKDVLDYLLKPISYPRFLKAVNKVILNKESKTVIENIPTEIELKTDGYIQKFAVDKITVVESIGNYIKIYGIKNTPIIVQQTMKGIEEILPEQLFLRVHKSYLVNKNSIQSKTKNAVLLENNISIPVGRKFSILIEKINIPSSK